MAKEDIFPLLDNIFNTAIDEDGILADGFDPEKEGKEKFEPPTVSSEKEKDEEHYQIPEVQPGMSMAYDLLASLFDEATLLQYLQQTGNSNADQNPIQSPSGEQNL